MRKSPNAVRKSSIAAFAAAAVLLTGGAVYATTGSGTAAPAVAPATDPDGTLTPPTNAAIEWNQALLAIVAAPPVQGATPSAVHPTRNFAILALAIDTAVNAIDHTHQPDSAEPAAAPGASAPAAAVTAAHDTLVELYPDHRTDLDTRLAGDLAVIGDDDAARHGVLVGQAAARLILDYRAHDGADTPAAPYPADPAPGRYQPTPPASAAPVFTSWGSVMPFVLHRGDQFRPAPPPALDSPGYAAALTETEQLGAKTSTARTAAQTEDATFWAAPIQNYWNTIADQVATAERTDLDGTAWLLARLDTTLADATIALYDAKYTYQLWRPITAIRQAASDNNDGTTPDSSWEPLATTPADPSYPGAHSDLSFAAATVLADRYGDNTRFTVTSPTLPGVQHTFGRFSDAATEAGLSRIYAGVHTRTDHDAGRELGIQIADYVLSLNHHPGS
jgi:membrane-associated phospholipid phosphatase